MYHHSEKLESGREKFFSGFQGQSHGGDTGRSQRQQSKIRLKMYTHNDMFVYLNSACNQTRKKIKKNQQLVYRNTAVGRLSSMPSYVRTSVKHYVVAEYTLVLTGDIRQCPYDNVIVCVCEQYTGGLGTIHRKTNRRRPFSRDDYSPDDFSPEESPGQCPPANYLPIVILTIIWYSITHPVGWVTGRASGL